jgi:hypothetical protein
MIGYRGYQLAAKFEARISKSETNSNDKKDQ